MAAMKALFGLAVAAIAWAPASAQYDATWTRYDEAQSRINAAYGAVMASVSPTQRAILRSQERSWIRARNAACGHEAKNECATHLTWNRVHQLEAMLSKSSNYRSMTDRQLLAYEDKLNDACKSGGQEADGPICEHRDIVFRSAENRGWCWGPDDAIEADRHWMRCGPDAHP